MLLKYHKHIAILSIIASVIFFLLLLKEIYDGTSLSEIGFFPAILMIFLIASFVISILILNNKLIINESTLVITYVQFINIMLCVLILIYSMLFMRPIRD